MLCLNCSREIPEDRNTCPYCDGTHDDMSVKSPESANNKAGNTTNETAIAAFESDDIPIVYASQADTTKADDVNGNSSPKQLLRRVPKPALIAATVVIVLLAGFLVFSETGKGALKSDFMGTWYASDKSIIQVLEINDSRMTYKLETGYSSLNSTLGTWQWRPTGANSFEVNQTGNSWESYTAEFSADKKAVTIKPALTSTDSYEVWVDIS